MKHLCVTYICMHLHNRSCFEIAELQRLSKASKVTTFLKEQRRQHVKTATHEPECKRTGNNTTSKQQHTNLHANTFKYDRPTGMKPLCVCATPCLQIPVKHFAAMIPQFYNTYNTLCETVNHSISLQHFPRTLEPNTFPQHSCTTPQHHEDADLHYNTPSQHYKVLLCTTKYYSVLQSTTPTETTSETPPHHHKNITTKTQKQHHTTTKTSP